MPKVLMLNGSPHEHGSCSRALSEIAGVLEEEGAESHVCWIGDGPVRGCTACGACAKLGRCVFDDGVNEFRALADAADGFVFGTPVYFGSANASMGAFLDRLFYSDGLGCEGTVRSKTFFMKPAASVATLRRTDSSGTLDQINRYFYHRQMPIVTSRSWSSAHGNTPEELAQDEEGLYTLRVLARNMAYLLHALEAARRAGVPLPKQEDPCSTNFIR